MFKKFLVGASAGVMALSLVALPTNAVVVPVQCTGMVFDHVIVGTQFGQSLKGTTGRDLIIGVGGDSIRGNSGEDCLVSGGLSSVKGEDGNDVIVGSSQDSIDGGNGHDVCSKGALSSIKNCE